MTANEINALVDRLREQRNLSDAEFKTILETDAYDAALQKAADEVRRAHYGTDVYVRGLIEFTNYCKNNCYYCGIRRDNRNVTRYRLTKEEILLRINMKPIVLHKRRMENWKKRQKL